MNSPAPKLSLLVPCFNEEGLLEDMVREQLAEIQALGVDHELVLIDDASQDSTSRIARGLAEALPNVRALAHTVNQGCGGSFLTGVRSTNAEWVILVPVDSPLDRVQLKAFLAAADQNDLVVGWRPRREGYGLARSAASRVLHLVLRHGFRLPPLRDYTWIPLIRRRVFDTIQVETRRILFLAEIVALASRRGFSIAEISCPMRARTAGEPTNARPITYFHTGAELARLALRLW